MRIIYIETVIRSTIVNVEGFENYTEDKLIDLIKDDPPNLDDCKYNRHITVVIARDE